ncbi:fibrobacter succinogenes major paralogous domain-containing protein [Saccharicrinis sp. FJH62]|uniref:fibrobacter succinogenes major paralogous domain-containing protein n=1 Tax=Saccharicrinis sp. FJH62 TaxID=3344657 RepID=UPI0035D4C3EC
MKTRLLIVALIAVTSFAAVAQSVPGFSYQAVARDAGGDVIANQKVGIEISILKNSVDGELAYVEEFSPTTNNYGIINLTIGTGHPTFGYFEDIDWSVGEYFVGVAMDTEGGTDYVDMSTSQLLSVPYAMYAKSASTAQSVDGVDAKTITDLKKSLADVQTQLKSVKKELMGTGLEDTRDPNLTVWYDTISTNDGNNWMADNLKAEIYTDGTPIQNVKSYNNDPLVAVDYGYLYTYDAIIAEGKNICPDGYRMPTSAEWSVLLQKYGGSALAGSSLKETGTFHWNVQANGVTGSAETEIIPAGMVASDGSSTGLGARAYVWTGEESADNPDYAVAYQFNAENNLVIKVNIKKDANISVRCIKE